MSIFDYFMHPDEFVRSHNCSGIDVDTVPLDERSHPILASSTIALATIYLCLYLPCMQSFWKQQRDGNTCYRLLFYSGLCDLYMICSLGLLHGYLSLKGAVYCAQPKLLFFTSAVHDGFFAAGTSTNLVLSLNRCLNILFPDAAKTLFEWGRIWIWLISLSLYGFYWALFVPPAIFNGIYFSYFFNPFMGYRNELSAVFHPMIHTFHDCMVCFGLPLIYAIFLTGLKLKMSDAADISNHLFNSSFLQVLMLSILHLTGIIYLVMQVVPVSWAVIVLAQYIWLHVHAFPPIIFLVVNRTVRHDCFILFHRIFFPNRVSRIFGVTVLRPKNAV